MGESNVSETAILRFESLIPAFCLLHPSFRFTSNIISKHRTEEEINRGFVSMLDIFAALALGWNFGDGHLADRWTQEAVLRKCPEVKEGDFIIVSIEGYSLFTNEHEYKVFDLRKGLIEKGKFKWDDVLKRTKLWE